MEREARRLRPVSEPYRAPVLRVMSLVPEPYILDLAPGQRLIELGGRRDFDVYRIDWGTLRDDDVGMRFEHDVPEAIPECVARVKAGGASWKEAVRPAANPGRPSPASTTIRASSSGRRSR